MLTYQVIIYCCYFSLTVRNGYTVYADGLTEQWGIDYTNSSSIINVTLPIQYSSTSYTIMATDVRNAVQSGTNTAIFVSSSTGKKTSSGFTLCQYSTSDFKGNWFTKGY